MAPPPHPPRSLRALALPFAALACAVAAGPAGAFPGANGDIVYAAAGGIDLVPAAGGAFTPLTQPTVDHSPAVSADGRKVVYVASKTLHVMNIDGSGSVPLATPGLDVDDPAWSPDGSKIVFAGAGAKKSDLYVIPAAGGAVVDLTNTDDHEEYKPTWSPDGSKIAYERSGCELQHGAGTCVYTMNADGS